MKRIEDIEKLTLEELERMADDESVAVPERLGENIENRILASEILRRESARGESLTAGDGAGTLNSGKRRSPVALWKRLAVIPAVAAAVASVVIGLNLHRASATPADTFSSPEEAYAQVERTFAMIGSKVSKGKSIADAALPKMQKTSKFFGHIPPVPTSSSEGNLYSE